MNCPHCRHGFALDYSHPTEMRLKECPECRGTGRLPEPPPRIEDSQIRDLSDDTEISRRQMGRHFGNEHADV